MRLLAFGIIFSCMSIAFAADITCPDPAQIRVTQGWAVTSQGNNQDNNIDWDGSLAKDSQPIGDLVTMDLTYAVWMNGYVIRCNYNNGQLSNIAPISGICSPKGILQNCETEKCTVKCVSTKKGKLLNQQT